MRTADLPVVFLSYDEPWGDVFWADLRAKAPHALRVHGVQGLDACHKAAARAAGTRWFLTIDADTLVDEEFFALDVADNLLSDQCRLEWASRNAVNGLLYNNGSIKLWPSKMVERLRSHEAAPSDRASVDHDIGRALHDRKAPQRIQMPGCHSTTHPAETAFHAFRCGFREGARIGKTDVVLDRPADFGSSVNDWKAQHLKVWCSIGAHARKGLWMIYGARLGLWMANVTEWDVRAINDYDWLDRFWQQVILPRFGPGGSRCALRGESWDEARLQTEVAALGRLIGAQLDFEVTEIPAEVSRLVCEAGGAALSAAHIDTMGYMLLKGIGVGRDIDRARDLFETGAAILLPASCNNLARMHDLRLIPDADPDEARALYQTALALGNPHAPWHLAQMLLTDPRADEDARKRAAALTRLARDRGFAPDTPEIAPEPASEPASERAAE